MPLNRLFLTFILIIVLASPINSYAKQTLAQRFEEQPTQLVTIPAGELEYAQFGKGTPVVLISGYAADLSTWNRYFLTELAKKHQVIIFNNRNIGRSKVSSSEYNTQVLAENTYQLIQHLGLKKPVIIGISMGGMIAQQLAVSHPESISQLILINTAISGKKAVHPEQAIKDKMLHIPTTAIGGYWLALNLFFPTEWRAEMAVSLIQDRFQPNRYHFNGIKPPILQSQQDLLLQWTLDETVAKQIEKLSMPVLILNGHADAIIPPINSLILKRTIPHAEMIRITDGGHVMIYQYPRGTARMINSFIKTHRNIALKEKA